jgi:hypothetical protein
MENVSTKSYNLSMKCLTKLICNILSAIDDVENHHSVRSDSDLFNMEEIASSSPLCDMAKKDKLSLMSRFVPHVFVDIGEGYDPRERSKSIKEYAKFFEVYENCYDDSKMSLLWDLYASEGIYIIESLPSATFSILSQTKMLWIRGTGGIPVSMITGAKEAMSNYLLLPQELAPSSALVNKSELLTSEKGKNIENDSVESVHVSNNEENVQTDFETAINTIVDLTESSEIAVELQSSSEEDALTNFESLIASERIVADDFFLLYSDATVDNQYRSISVGGQIYWIYPFHYPPDNMDARDGCVQRHEYIYGSDRLLLRRYEQKAVVCVQLEKVMCYYIILYII